MHNFVPLASDSSLTLTTDPSLGANTSLLLNVLTGLQCVALLDLHDAMHDAYGCRH